MRIAYCVSPKIGGTYNFFCNLEDALRPRGGEVLCVSVGAEMAGWQRGDPFVRPSCVKVAGDEADPAEAGRQFVAWVKESAIDVVIPMNSRSALAAVPFLPGSTALVSRCSNTTAHTYGLVAGNQAYASAIACSSLRQRDDLAARHGVPESKLALIPHGVDVARFDLPRVPAPAGRIRLGMVGRIEDKAKGVFDVPDILHEVGLSSGRWTLEVVGSGPDEASLRRRMSHWIERGYVTFHGAVPNAEVPDYLRRFDVLLMPSHFEGFGFSLIEAMAAGCVPLVSRLRGVTDWIVKDGVSGMLLPIGDVRSYARSIEWLASDHRRIEKLSAAARAEVASRFSIERFGSHWAELLMRVAEAGGVGPRRGDVENLRVPTTWNWKRWIPQRLKGRARGWLERRRAGG